MADFNIQPIGAQIKPVQGMSLADMINVARGAQAFQQAEQMNPLEVQIRQQQARTGEIALGVEEQKNIERKNFQTFMSDPNNYMTDNKFDDQKFNIAIPKIMPLTGMTAINDLTSLAKAQSDALVAKHNLTQGKRELVSRTLGLAGRANADPATVNEMLDMLVEQNPNDQDLKNLVERGYKPVFQRIKPGPQFADMLVKSSQQMLTPSQLETTFEPKVTVTESGQTVTTQKMPGTAQPTVTIGIAGGLQKNVPAPTTPIVSGTEVAPGMRVPYPVRRADQPYMAEPSEQKDQTAGTAFRERLVEGQNMLAQGRRNVSEVIQQANKINEALIVPNFLAQYGFEKGGTPEAAERAVRRFFGSEQYDMLAKDLANMAITNSKAMGTVGGTVAGLDMASVANGTIKVTPDILIKIARRVQADQTNLDMQASGAQKFFENFGDNNMKAFQQAWNANSKDTRVFEAMNLMETESDPEKLNAEFKKLFPSEKKRKTILKQYQNLKSMAATGVPVQPLTPEDF